MKLRFLSLAVVTAAVTFTIPGAQAAFHVMQIEEVIGSLNGNTSAQAIQLRLRSSGQNLVANSKLWAWDAAGTNRVLLLDIASNVSNSASGARILLTTSGFTSTMIAGGATTFTPDFTLASNIPFTYLSAGRLTYEDDGGSVATPGTIYWSLAWGGASYLGSNTGSTTNDADGNFGPAVGSNLRIAGFDPGVIFGGTATAPSTSNSADYSALTNAATVTKNNGASFTVVPEPGLAGLLGMGSLCLWMFAWRRRAS